MVGVIWHEVRGAASDGFICVEVPCDVVCGDLTV